MAEGIAAATMAVVKTAAAATAVAAPRGSVKAAAATVAVVKAAVATMVAVKAAVETRAADLEVMVVAEVHTPPRTFPIPHKAHWPVRSSVRILSSSHCSSHRRMSHSSRACSSCQVTPPLALDRRDNRR